MFSTSSYVKLKQITVVLLYVPCLSYYSRWIFLVRHLFSTNWFPDSHPVFWYPDPQVNIFPVMQRTKVPSLLGTYSTKRLLLFLSQGSRFIKRVRFASFYKNVGPMLAQCSLNLLLGLYCFL